ncbi:NAD(P)H quinone oxidoreductase [Microlunatus endophyticus]|uniref:NAD(P)H quinone oxidoreductase n=1 Tax=Microlunatus endophyticus TaxID=1716077 RepID=A0A917W829_9ACTN|nr:NAD(P)H-quinone oxidoreductase [Microlunatus endophyticus]GGL75128.1 NAD(P)H quinone oxidoreductase [Microlunatus endophyticus]
MRAVTVDQPGGPDVLRLAEIADPEPGPGELLVKVVAAGVNRADLQQRIGVYPPPKGASDIIGLECSGTVAALGEGVEGWQPGDSCVALLAGGGYAELVAVPAGQVVRPPEGVDLVTAGGLIEVAATVVSNCDLALLATGETFLVHGGAGGIGSFAIRYATQLGARVITTAGSEDKLAYCRALGADLAVSYREDWAAAVADFTQGAGVDVILDNMGAKYLEANLGALAVDGRLMIIGMQGGNRAEINLGRLLVKRGTVSATSLRGRPVAQKAKIVQRVADAVWPLYASGRLTPTEETRFALADAAQAHARLESGENIGKILLLP